MRENMSGVFNFMANPTRFALVAKFVRPIAFWGAVGGFAWGLYLALLASPPDYQQGDAVRIMYVHVPAAWLALSSYLALGVASMFYLIWRHQLGHIAAQAIAPVGMGFAALTLITGSLWGYPIWGTWWVWDARLTSMLVLFFFFVGYVMLAHGFEQRTQGAQMAALLALIGCVNLPIVKFSVDWWHTLHQPASILRQGGMAIDETMLWPLFVMSGAFQLFFIWITLHRMTWMMEARKLNRKKHKPPAVTHKKGGTKHG